MTPPLRRSLATETGRLGDTFRFVRLSSQIDLTDPFLSIDHYWMSGPTFPAHPHAGFAAVTYMFDDAETALENKDSQGDRSLIEPGDLHWTVAGSGVVHEETPKENGKTAHGLQIFVNLPEALQERPAFSMHQAAAKRPVVESGGARRVIVFGEHEGVSAPMELPVDATLVDLFMTPGSSYRPSIDAERTRFIYVAKGSVEIDGKPFRSGQACAFSEGATLASNELTHAALFHGPPLRQPVHFVGPVAMASEEKAQRVMSRYRQGLLGRIS